MGAGLAHRHSFFAAERARRPYLLLVDNGNVADEPRKLATVLRIMAMDRYDAVGTGALDAQQADAYVRDTPPGGIPLVRAVARGDALDGPASGLRLKQLRGHTLGVTSLPPAPAGAEAAQYLDAAVRALGEMRGRCEFLILLSQLGLEGDKDLARRCGGRGPHVIVGNLDAEGLPGPLQVEGSLLLPTGPGGFRAGLVEIAFPLLGPPRVEAVLVVPAKDETTDPAVKGIIDAFYAEEYRRFEKRFDPRLLAEKMGEGAGDNVRCRECHPTEYDTWHATRHARAVESLIKHKRLVPECLVCHSTRFRDTGAFDRAARAGDVDCTGCHPAAGEGETSSCPENSTRTHGPEACRECHTKGNSPNFAYGSYYARVNHVPRGPQPPPSHLPGGSSQGGHSHFDVHRIRANGQRPLVAAVTGLDHP